MAGCQGDLALLNDPIAQPLLQSTIPARLAYSWTDGTPRVVPIWFHWTGEEFVLGSPPGAPKLKALASEGPTGPWVSIGPAAGRRQLGVRRRGYPLLR
jgi:hypothetical protein